MAIISCRLLINAATMRRPMTFVIMTLLHVDTLSLFLLCLLLSATLKLVLMVGRASPPPSMVEVLVVPSLQLIIVAKEDKKE